MGPKYRRECLPNETVLNLGKRKSEFLKNVGDGFGTHFEHEIETSVDYLLVIYRSCPKAERGTILKVRLY